MKRLLPVLGGIALVFPVTPAPAHEVTVIQTTQKDVKSHCAGQTECTTACGDTLCDYVCKDPKTQCTATVFMKGQTVRGGKRPTTTPTKAK